MIPNIFKKKNKQPQPELHDDDWFTLDEIEDMEEE